MSVRRILGFFSDRRGQARLDSDLRAHYVVLDGVGGEALSAPQSARVVTISAGGCCLAVAGLAAGQFHLTRCLEAPEDNPLLVTVQGAGVPAWRLLGLVRWTNREMRPDDETMPFRVGLQWAPGGGPPPGWRRHLAHTARD